jgi:sulfhydrogenase subunit beta (sulfur reductase)
MYTKIRKENFYSFLINLTKYGKIFAPVKRGDSFYEFKEISSFKGINLIYPRTMISPKKFFLKPKEKLFDFDEVKNLYKQSNIKKEPFILLGVHPCDIHALKILDKIYLDEIPDQTYAKKRKNSIIIGINCYPDDYCFCESTGTSYASDGFDLFLHELNNSYFVRIGSET